MVAPDGFQLRYFAPRDGPIAYRLVWRVWLSLYYQAIEEIDKQLDTHDREAELVNEMREYELEWPRLWDDMHHYDEDTGGHCDDSQRESYCGNSDCEECKRYYYK